MRWSPDTKFPWIAKGAGRPRLTHHHKGWWNETKWMRWVWRNGGMKFVVGENGRNPEKNLPRPRFVHHETHMEWPRRELGTTVMGGERLTACATRPPRKPYHGINSTGIIPRSSWYCYYSRFHYVGTDQRHVYKQCAVGEIIMEGGPCRNYWSKKAWYKNHNKIVFPHLRTGSLPILEEGKIKKKNIMVPEDYQKIGSLHIQIIGHE